MYVLVSPFVQGFQKGPGSHSAGPNGEPPYSSSSSFPQTLFSPSCILNQVGHSSGPYTASSAASSLSPTSPQPTPNHLSSPPHCATTSGVHTKDTMPLGAKTGGICAAATLPSGPQTKVWHSTWTPLSPSTTSVERLTNDVQLWVTGSSASLSQPGSPSSSVLSSDNPQLSALHKGKGNATRNYNNNDYSNHSGSSSEKFNNVHASLHSPAKPLSEQSVAFPPLLSTAVSSPQSIEPNTTSSLCCLNSPSNPNSQGPAVNGNGLEDSQSPQKAEVSGGAQRHSVPAHPDPWSSVSIYPSSGEVLKVCR